MPQFHSDHDSPESQESINVRIRLDSCKIVNFSTHSVMFYNSVAKQVRSSYEYLRDSAGFGYTISNSLRCAKAYVEMMQESTTN